MNSLEQLRRHTVVVADTGDFNAMREYLPRDATTNPSLILKAVQKDAYRPLLAEAVAAHRAEGVEAVIDRLIVRFGREILAIVPGRVSTEVDARLSFDTQATIAKARTLIAHYEEAGVDRARVLIKIAATWEGIRAARTLESEGISCNLTLVFGLPQAAACADAGVTLISPFVGRILDWHRKQTGEDYAPAADPGVQSVKRIYAYYKALGVRTEVMGASFRNAGQILELAGCDLLTISPELLAQLAQMRAEVPRKLDPQAGAAAEVRPLNLDEPRFRFALNEDAMATEKLAEGIRLFVADAVKLESLIAQHA